MLDRCIANPNSPAVYDPTGTVYSYSALVRQASDLATRLGHVPCIPPTKNESMSSAEKSVSIVAVALPRSFDLIAALLGVWASGRAVVIIDAAALPAERVELMLCDCCVSHIVTNSGIVKHGLLASLWHVLMSATFHRGSFRVVVFQFVLFVVTFAFMRTFHTDLKGRLNPVLAHLTASGRDCPDLILVDEERPTSDDKSPDSVSLVLSSFHM